jgi:hypothetical protein
VTRSAARPGSSSARPCAKWALVAALGLGLGAVCAVGCGGGAEGGCPALASCVGDPTGTWTATAADACQYRPVRPAQPADVNSFVGKGVLAPTLAPPQPQPVMSQQSTSGDWCSALVYSTAMPPVSYVTLWHDAPAFAGGQVSFNSDHTYSVKLTFSTPGYANGEGDPDAGTGTGAPPGAGSNATHFAPICLLAYGATPTCDDLTQGLTAFYKPVPPATASFQNIRCAPASDGGCDCSYVYVVVVQDSGTWSVSGDTLLEDSTMGSYSYNGLLLTTQGAPSQVPAQPMQATFCKQNGQLLLTGARGSSLSWVTGLRTMKLTPM